MSLVLKAKTMISFENENVMDILLITIDKRNHIVIGMRLMAHDLESYLLETNYEITGKVIYLQMVLFPFFIKMGYLSEEINVQQKTLGKKKKKSILDTSKFI